MILTKEEMLDLVSKTLYRIKLEEDNGKGVSLLKFNFGEMGCPTYLSTALHGRDLEIMFDIKNIELEVYSSNLVMYRKVLNSEDFDDRGFFTRVLEEIDYPLEYLYTSEKDYLIEIKEIEENIKTNVEKLKKKIHLNRLNLNSVQVYGSVTGFFKRIESFSGRNLYEYSIKWFNSKNQLVSYTSDKPQGIFHTDEDILDFIVNKYLKEEELLVE